MPSESLRYGTRHMVWGARGVITEGGVRTFTPLLVENGGGRALAFPRCLERVRGIRGLPSRPPGPPEPGMGRNGGGGRHCRGTVDYLPPLSSPPPPPLSSPPPPGDGLSQRSVPRRGPRVPGDRAAPPLIACSCAIPLPPSPLLSLWLYWFDSYVSYAHIFCHRNPSRQRYCFDPILSIEKFF